VEPEELTDAGGEVVLVERNLCVVEELVALAPVDEGAADAGFVQ